MSTRVFRIIYIALLVLVCASSGQAGTEKADNEQVSSWQEQRTGSFGHRFSQNLARIDWKEWNV
jgi:hypothetical protein